MALSSARSGRVLVIDDDADTRANLCDILELDDYQVETAGSAAEALAHAGWRSLLAILLDRRLPDSTSDELLPQLKQLAPDAAILIITGFADLQGAIAALRQGAADYILKPINPEALRATLARIAERRHAAEEIERLNRDLRERVHELQTLLDVIPIGIAIAQDTECKKVVVNAALARLLQLPADAVISWPAVAGVYPGRRVFRDGKEIGREELPLLQAASKGVEVAQAEIQIEQADGRLLDLLVSAAPLFNEQRRPRGAVAAILDITERKRNLERVLQAERLAAIGQMMTGLAHESGNALARSQACLEMLSLEVQDRPDALDLIVRIQKAQDHLRQLYEEVRSYAAPLKLQREVQDLTTVWRQAWNSLAMLRKGRQATLIEEWEGISLECPIDPFRLEQVFRNILENALVACADPTIIRIQCTAARLHDQPAVCLAIQDNGPGLNAEQRERIFEPFFTTKTKGTGLGMAIARRIVEVHGGQIGVGTRAGGGAEIIITLPQGAA